MAHRRSCIQTAQAWGGDRDACCYFSKDDWIDEMERREAEGEG